MRGVCISSLSMAAAADRKATKTTLSRTLRFFSSHTARDQIHTQQSNVYRVEQGFPKWGSQTPGGS